MEVTIRGVADNAQLHWLLASAVHAALPAGVAKWQAPPKDVQAVFMGEGPKDVAIGDVEGVFNMYNW